MPRNRALRYNTIVSVPQRVEELEERVRVAEAQVASHWELLRRLYDVILVFDMSGKTANSSSIMY